MDLDIDPFEITSWKEYAKACLAAGELWRFRKALSDYIYFTNLPCQKEIKEYANRRFGEFLEEDIRKDVSRRRAIRELYAESIRQEKIRNMESR